MPKIQLRHAGVMQVWLPGHYKQLGLLNATDIIGGYKAWKDAGLPVKMKPSSSVSLPTSLVP